jgi:hypothetical protein
MQINVIPALPLPNVFIGCSTEAFRVAQAIQNNLDLRAVAFTKIWSQNNLLPSNTTIEDLVRIAPTYDFAVFILSPDDLVKSRGTEQLAPRDNVIFEAGLFIGALTRDRVFLVKQRGVTLKLPSDWLGVKTIDYFTPPDNYDWEAALGPVSNIVEIAIQRMAPHTPAQRAILTSQEQYRNAAQYFDKFLEESYRISASANSLTCLITDLEGSAIVRKSCQGLKVLGGIKLEQIYGKIEASAPGSKITGHPTLIGPVDFNKPVSIKHKVKKDNLSEFDVVITGGITNRDPNLSYEYETAIFKGYLMTREEVNEAYQGSDFKNEYVSLKMDMPTDKAVLEIGFPAGYVAQTAPGVFIGDSESMHDSELNRNYDGFEPGERGARFTINKPLVGFTYIISWDAPPREVFDKLRMAT